MFFNLLIKSRNAFLFFNKKTFSRFSFLGKKSVFTFVLFLVFSCAFGQDLEPRVYANMPKNLNVAVLGYNYFDGNVLADPSLPIEGFETSSHGVVAGYVKTFGIANRLSRVQVVLPYIYMDGKLTSTAGEIQSGSRSGLADMRIRFGINLFGSPALGKNDFANFRQKTIFGASLVTSVPTGQYFEEEKINLGSNRWAFKPEVGVSRRFESFYVESYIGIWFYTKNNEFLVDQVKSQDPALSAQFHSSYYFKNQMWLGFNANWYIGGSSTIEGVKTSDDLDTRRIGGTWSIPIGTGQSVKLQFHIDADKSSDVKYNSVSLSYQYSFF